MINIMKISYFFYLITESIAFRTKYGVLGDFDIDFISETSLKYKNVDAFFHQNGEKFSLSNKALSIIENEVIHKLTDTIGSHSLQRYKTRNADGLNR